MVGASLFYAVKYSKVRWYPDLCKRCLICIQMCPRQALVLKDDRVVQLETCDRLGLCERFCPDFAIEVLEPRRRGTP